jgi:UDP-N-acetylmuramyl pentapeptide synthase
MQRTFKTTIALGLLLIAAACGPSVDVNALKAENKDSMKALVTTLESIQDEKSALAAVAKLKELGAQARDFKKQRETLSDAEMDTLKDTDAEMQELGTRMMVEMKRIRQDDELSPHVNEALNSFWQK